jgi:hypothetical protein
MQEDHMDRQKALALSGLPCLSFGDFAIFLDVILEERAMLLFLSFQQFLCLARTSNQISLPVSQPWLARLRRTRW